MLSKVEDATVEEFPWGRIEWLVSQARENSETMTFGRVTIHAGQTNTLHRHPNCDEILHLLQGQLEHRVGEESFPLRAGDSIVIAQNQWHNARAGNEQDAVMLVCYSSAQRETETHDNN